MVHFARIDPCDESLKGGCLLLEDVAQKVAVWRVSLAGKKIVRPDQPANRSSSSINDKKTRKTLE
jgi:hypothetical protein